MASFISRLFGGGKKKKQPAPSAPAAASTKPTPRKEGRSMRPGKASQTVYTKALGISQAEKSGYNKRLVGQ